MSEATKSALRLEIAHVLFIDIVSYSKLLIDEQRDYLHTLNEVVRATDAFRTADAAGKLTTLPTGDGMALVFATTPDAPVVCALEIAKALKHHPNLQVRMGIHSGPVSGIVDVSQRSNIAGAGINMAQRVMDCGDAGHILLSKRVADDLEQYREWREDLHDLGECEVKHGVRVHVVNLYTDELGNSAVPEKFSKVVEQQPPARAPVTISDAKPKRSPWGVMIALLLVVAAFLAAAVIFVRRPTANTVGAPTASAAPTPASIPPAAPEKSIAVLPFENLSRDPDNAFFAQGIQDEIITTLSRISGLRVISRTSTAHYNSAPENLAEIAHQLRVSHVLEGSVQKAGDQVHINVQLIQAETDAHLWAQSYDRKLIDIFSVEAEVAKTIADSLRTTLSPQEKARVEAKPTDNADAYVLYLKGRDYQTRPDNLLQDFRTAAKLYEQAIALDPKFALAHARLSVAASTIYHFYQPTEQWKQQAHAEALESLRLQPNLGEGHLALGLYHYYMEGDYDAALRELGLAGSALPNDGDVGLYTAAVQRRQGHWTEALTAYLRAESVDPRNSVMLYDASQTFFGLRDWQTAAERMDRVLALAPDSFNIRIQRAYIEFFSKGTTAPIKAVVDSFPPNLDPDGVVTFARWDVSLMNRDVVGADRALAACQLDTIASQTGAPLPKSYLKACVDLVRGDPAKAKAEFESSRAAIEKTVADSPQDGVRRAQLGLLYAFLGRKEDALREGQHAMELKPLSHDVIEGAVVEDFYTLICARVGEIDEAISRIERLLTVPFAVDYADESITLSDLRHRWEWDPLRNDPRFQKILPGPEPKTSYK
jgi:TolB-like protein/class 3 adenylate cyclase